MLTVRRRSVNKPDPYLQMEYRHVIEQMAAPPPEERTTTQADEAWADSTIDRLLAGKGL